MSDAERTLKQKRFSRFGAFFEVRVRDIYQDPEDSTKACICWDAVCEGQIPPPQIVKVNVTFRQEGKSVNCHSVKMDLAEDFLNGVNIRQHGEILILNVFDNSPAPWQNQLGTSVQWHPRFGTFNETAWREKAA